MREKLKDKERLNHILEAIENILEFTLEVDFNSFSKNRILQFAIIKNLEIIGEAANFLTIELKDQAVDIKWRDIIGLRHVLVHGYYQISNEIIWKTIENDLLPLKNKVLAILDEFE
ncbi:MAG: DUF86 domain-containing protein [Desulfobacula sp.]|uniref:HepT-like ribonuclease domain-containing protein n=1 Tax=Desulfobacula sp. TaxID=2593537 RepID=UPI0025C0BDC6|nr:DUF86 domain-containing protein [Desulfobacula sp.]MCD4721760.1 DUF86 domain-containing protein [Desulfobacula sp.]